MHTMTGQALRAAVAAVLLAMAAPAGAARYGWEPVPPGDLRSHYRQLLRVTLSSGERIEGMLVDVIGTRVRLQLARRDGGGDRRLDLGRVARVEVLRARHDAGR